MIPGLLSSRVWPAIEAEMNGRIAALLTQLEAVSPDKLPMLQGRIKEVRRMLDIMTSKDETYANE